MPFTHRGQSTGDNHKPVSRAAKRDIASLARMSGGDSRNIPTEHLKSAVERHGNDIIEPLFNAVSAHRDALWQQRQKQAQRAEKIESIKSGIINKVAPYRATAFEMERRYGGPEEGGWYYDAGEPVAHSRPYFTESGARKGAKKMREEFPTTGSRSSTRNMRSSDMHDADRASGADMYDYESGREHSSSGYNPAYDPDADYDVSWQRGKGKPYPDRRPYYE